MKKSTSCRITLKNDIAEIRRLVEELSIFFLKNSLVKKAIHDITLVLEEIVSNIIFYGYDDPFEHEIKININLTKSNALLVIIDDGKPFNPIQVTEPDFKKGIEARKAGGLGVFFVKRIASKIRYLRKDGENQLAVTVTI
ncbi:MAG: ATP-binding protein [Candidatus Theseobacter exili]|nr:ATP-binding protein [Candidatus Theseobacter exili]